MIKKIPFKPPKLSFEYTIQDAWKIYCYMEKFHQLEEILEYFDQAELWDEPEQNIIKAIQSMDEEKELEIINEIAIKTINAKYECEPNPYDIICSEMYDIIQEKGGIKKLSRGDK